MKYGSHAGDDPDAILLEKAGCLLRSGSFMWGYNGTLCNPRSQVLPFLEELREKGRDLYLVLSPTRSTWNEYGNAAAKRATNGVGWEEVPAGLTVRGSRFAIECDSIAIGRCFIDLREFSVAVGKHRGAPLSSYLKGRVSKACAERGAVMGDRPRPLSVNAIAHVTNAYYLL